MASSFRVLVMHFFGRFFDVESTSADVDARTRIIQLLALLSVPGLMISFFMMADHPAGSMFVRGAFSETDRLWLRVGDHYVFVAYAIVAMGLLMTLKWDSLFPDRRDYLILTSLPISSRRWFAAKVLALCGFLGLFIVAINFFSLLLVPTLLAEQSKLRVADALPQTLLAHAAGTAGGSIFAALFFAALQGALINVLSPDAFRRISPRVQAISIAILVTLLLIIPLVKDSIPALVQNESPLLDYFPLMWFLGVYEVLLPGATLMPQAIEWARTAMDATIFAALVFAISYFAGYRRYSRKVLESVESETLVLRRWKTAAAGVLDRTILTHPVQRGTFHFIGKMASRSTRHRILTAMYWGIGIALSVSSLCVIDRGTFRVSTMGALAAPLILCFVVISGLRATFNVPSELNANWMFQVGGDGNSSHFLAAIRKWIFLYRILPLFAVLAVFEFEYFTPWAALSHITFDLVIAGLLIEAFFFRFNKVPFTCSYTSNKVQLVALAAGYLYGFTTYIGIALNLKRAMTAAAPRMAVFLFLAGGLFAILRKLQRGTSIVYQEDEAAILSLSADTGYWKAPQRLKPRRSLNVRPDFPAILNDLRYGARILWKSPALSATAVVLIALVIGLNTTVYSIVHAFITRPAPGVLAKDLVVLATPAMRAEPFHSYPEYLDFAAQTKTLRAVIGYGPEPITFGSREGSYGLFGSYVTPDYFDGLGVQLVRGRGFNEADDRAGGSGLAAVISHRVWQEQFRGADDVIGRAITVNGHPAMIVGVAAPLFQGAELPIPDDIWVPAASYFRVRGRERLLNDRRDGGFGFMVMAQLKPNVSLSEAQAEFATISGRLQAAYPATNKNKLVQPMPYSATFNAGISHFAPQFLAIFSVVTGLTLIIVCANVANLLLARAVARQRETAVRQSLGASRPRILRTLVAEGVAISTVAWATASVFAFWVSTYVPRLIVPSGSMNGLGMRPNHMNMDLSPDTRVLAYAMLLALIGTVFFCIAPALRMWNQELLPGLKTGELGVVRGRSKLSSALVVVQLAFSVVLLTSAGLAYRSLSLVDSLDVGFNKDNLLLVTVNPTLSITNREANLAFLERVRERLRTVAGVTAVSYVRLPPPYSVMRVPVGNPNLPKPIVANTNYIGPEYLRTLGLTPVLGREFVPEDNTEHGRDRKTAIVSLNLARALWPGQSALGQTIPIDGGRDSAEIVGVTPNALFSDRDEPYFLFLAEQQDRSRITGQAALFGSGETTFYLRYAGNLDSIGPAIRVVMRDIDERVPVLNMRTMQVQLDGGHNDARTLAAFLSLFSGGSLLIAAMGQYAVIAFEMKRRSREFGIRAALGASGRQIQRSVLKEGLALTAIGLLIGFGLSLSVGLALRGFLTGVTPTDWKTYAGVFGMLAVTSLAALLSSGAPCVACRSIGGASL